MIRPGWHSLEDLMKPAPQGWGYTQDQLYTLVEDGQLTITLKTVRGEVREGITAEERQRVEGPKHEREPRSDAKRTDAEALAIVWAYAFGKDQDALRRFSNAAELERFAATAGFPLTRGTRTLADRFRGAIDVLVGWGFLKRDEADGAMESKGDERKAA